MFSKKIKLPDKLISLVLSWCLMITCISVFSGTKALALTDDTYIFAGDAYRDGRINIKDALSIQKHIAKISSLSSAGYRCADFLSNPGVNIRCATYIEKYLAKFSLQGTEGEKIGNYLGMMLSDFDEEINEPSYPAYRVVTPLGDSYSSKIEEGGVVTYTFELQADESIQGIQAVLNYDSSFLKLLNSDELNEEKYSEKLQKYYPVLQGSVMSNAEIENEIHFNATSTYGFSFEDWWKNDLITVQFEILKEGETEISLDISHLYSNNKDYIFYGEEKDSGAEYKASVDIVNPGISCGDVWIKFNLEPMIIYPEKMVIKGETGSWWGYYRDGEISISVNNKLIIKKKIGPGEFSIEADFTGFKAGDKVCIYSADIASLTYSEYYTIQARGDANQDYMVNIKDATHIQKYAAKIIKFTQEQKSVADFNQDGAVNIKDVTAVQKFIAKFR